MSKIDALIQKLCPDGVEYKTLGENCDFVRGPFGGALKKEFFREKGYAVYEQQHAIYKTLDFRYFIDEKKYEKMKRFSIKPGVIIVSCSGTIGKTFVIPENAPKGIINQALLMLTPNENLNVFYLQYFFVINFIVISDNSNNIHTCSDITNVNAIVIIAVGLYHLSTT